MPRGVPLSSILVGSARLSPQDLVAFKMFTGHAFFGNIRLPAWPAIPHHLRIFSLRDQPWLVTAAVLIAFATGFLTAVWASLEMAYDKGGAVFLMGATGLLDETVHLLQNPKVGDPGKWGVWGWGLFEAGGIAAATGPLSLVLAPSHWAGFPAHLGHIHLLVQLCFWSGLLNYYCCATAESERTARASLFSMALGVGYVIGVVLSGLVDVIWFPTQGHNVHDW